MTTNSISELKRYNSALISLVHAAVPTHDQKKVNIGDCITNGVLFIKTDGSIINGVDESIFETARDWNFSWDRHFHKSWEKVAYAPKVQLAVEQLMHYASTYGLASLGLAPRPFLPLEKVYEKQHVIPGKLKVIRIVDIDTAIQMSDDYLKATLKPNTNDMLYIAEFINHTKLTADDIKSFEIQCLYCHNKKVVPSDSQTLLRYLVYETTGNTLIIKNRDTIKRIKNTLSYQTEGADVVHTALSQADLTELSKIFLRNKLLFLAFKADQRNAPIINKIRRLAVENHQPLSEVTTANVMDLLNHGRQSDVEKVLRKTSIRNLIKLINFASDIHSDKRLYNIRNGKVFINTKKPDEKTTLWLHDNATAILKERMTGKLAGKKFYIPEGIKYAAPISEKQMIGGIPYGTTIEADPDDPAICLSIAWENFNGRQTDIDLHAISATQHVGWNSTLRSEDYQVLHSGDMTDATNGATETVRFNANDDDPFIVSVHLYHGDSGCPFKTFLSRGKDFKENKGRNAQGMIDISTALSMPITLKLDSHDQTTIGFVLGKTFTVYGGQLGPSIVPKLEYYRDALNAITHKCHAMLPLESLIEMGGGEVIRNDETGGINLSPESVTAPDLFAIVDAE